ncbi:MULTISPECIES: hypothetical protein [Haloarcula]|uniref:hypothetical protein n=1 Tax=Haloarcula TaxID=2237 RepID=UPI001665123B|nr:MULTISPECIES: hypothetical protein [Halomicroarcula]MBX0349460.1 hypothetical protein [Halomicroarcula pellucida]MDS0278957.1 hypothetical protein [Halomicroarcula sp. S1AR25-4]
METADSRQVRTLFTALERGETGVYDLVVAHDETTTPELDGGGRRRSPSVDAPARHGRLDAVRPVQRLRHRGSVRLGRETGRHRRRSRPVRDYRTGGTMTPTPGGGCR